MSPFRHIEDARDLSVVPLEIPEDLEVAALWVFFAMTRDLSASTRS
jgi:hypothetical protein